MADAMEVIEMACRVGLSGQGAVRVIKCRCAPGYYYCECQDRPFNKLPAESQILLPPEVSHG